ncbi:MAG: VanZ family protein [Acidobacteriota bacterium]|nr:VanZ family protein [Acidobacteriota bacterium]
MNKRTLNRQVEKEYSSTRQRLWRYGPLIFWIVFISFASTSAFSSLNTSTVMRPLLLLIFPNLSDAQMAAIHFLIRKVAHFTEYAILAFLARRAFISSSFALFQRRWFQIGLLLVVIHALLDEFHQSFVPSRTPSIYDSAIDVAGGLTVLLICKLYGKRTEKRRVVVV